MRFALLLLLALTAYPQTLLVLHKGDSSLGFYTMEGRLLAKVPVGQHPHEIVLSPDRRFAYVTDNGTMRIEHAGTGGNTVSIIDLAARARVGQIDLGTFRRPHGIDLDPKTGHLMVTTELPDQLLQVDPKARKVVRTYDTGGKTTHMVTLGPGGTHAYASNSGSAEVAVINLSSGAVSKLPTGTRPEGSTRSPDGRFVYVVNREAGQISVIDTGTRQVTSRIPTGKGPVRIAVTPDGKTLVYAVMHDHAVEFADPATRRVVGRVPIEGQPVSLTLSPDGKLAFASAEERELVHVISVPERRLLRTLTLGKGMGPDPVLLLP